MLVDDAVYVCFQPRELERRTLARLRNAVATVDAAWVSSVGGRPILYVAPRGRRLQTFAPTGDDDQALTRACEALHRLPRHRTLIIEQIDGLPAREAPLAERLRACGFCDDYRGLAAEIGYSPRRTL